MIKHIRTILFIITALYISGCKSNTTEAADNPNNPFVNGTNNRDLIVVFSDIHLGADLQYAEIKSNLPQMEAFLEKVRTSPNVKELVINGDFIDEWFVPAYVNTYQGKDQKDFVKRVAAANNGVIDVLNKIIKEKNVLVTYVPGNHDLTITASSIESILPGINQARDEMQGLGTYSPVGHPEIAIEHGHRYNFFCAPDPFSNSAIAPGSITPPGYFFTRIATTHVVQKCTVSKDSILPATVNSSGNESQNLLYAYWKLWEWTLKSFPIENKFDEKIIVTNVDGLTQTYSVNDVIPYQNEKGGFINVNLYNGIQDNWERRQQVNKVAVNIPTLDAIKNSADDSETDRQATVQYFSNTNSNKRLVVFGHSHQAKILPVNNYKGEKSLYVNSGTWIDKNKVGTTMNFVIITPQSSGVSKTTAGLYFYNGTTETKIAEDSY